MSGSDEAGRAGEFAEIARLFRPLTRGAPEALDLLDDAAALPSRPGHDLVITTDALVEGVHFLPGDPLDLVARKLLRVNLSDLAAKAAQPYGYLLTVAWSGRCDLAQRERFARGLAEDGEAFQLVLLGGDTVSTPGPLTVSATFLGWVPSDAMIRRSGARAGDRLLVSGVIGQGALGLRALRGQIDDPGGDFSRRYRLPHPRLELRDALRRHASAAADVSDGVIADAGHIARASGLALAIDLDRLPVPPGYEDARAELAGAGDDYELVCAMAPGAAAPFIAQAAALGVRVTDVGQFAAGSGVTATLGGQPVTIERAGYQHDLERSPGAEGIASNLPS